MKYQNYTVNSTTRQGSFIGFNSDNNIFECEEESSPVQIDPKVSGGELNFSS